MKKFAAVAASILALPFSVAAQVTQNVSNLNGIILFIKNILNTALPLIIAAAVVWFVWSMFQVFLAGEEDKKKKAQTNALWGIIAIFLMVSIWGLVNILYNSFGLDRTNRGSEVVNQLPGNLGN